ncbi:MocR-like pyridoxine biosynthesis transcription factor PdxR [Amycolatopsis sp. H20-H5]|uniref:MocR-like pyridoxine biosynthesis transcription factor PdxR n=1 Tax=Amycolatopsis sp. H20-H5 TaxID=3046309 RepID=UPI002DBA8C6E|nr:PLP-dependent aminotransferase family protein [Amycolatopsis sp. H20-H5]MEC3973976.1 PLP-dependent aminotransferase family protein [Amycolatopsis sp. H20-H5]
MEIHIDLSRGRGYRDAIYRQIRAAILDGRIQAGEALPPSRELAQRLAVSRTTVSAAYDRLMAEGFLQARVGSGTFVRAGSERQSATSGGRVTEARPLAEWDDVPELPAAFAPAPEFDFRAGVPDLSRFPFDTWRRLVTRQIRASRADLLTYGDPQGHPGLRVAIARHVGVARDVRAGAADVVITSGAQQTIDLVARVLLRRGDLAAVEDPGYPPPRLLLTTLGVRPVPVPMDGEGIVVAEIPAGCRLVYVTPSHHYPLGTSMSLERRLELLDWAARHDAVILEDDYDTEFRYTGRPLEPLHSLDSRGRVVYVGSFSKVLSPALRLGFMVAPPSLVPSLVKAKYLSTWHSPNLEQAALAEFIDEGGFARHIRKMRKTYRERHELVREVLLRDFGGVLEPIPSDAGLHLSAYATRDPRDVVRAARDAGILLYPLSWFSVRTPRPAGLVFGYGALPTARIEPGLARLRALFGEPRDTA